MSEVSVVPPAPIPLPSVPNPTWVKIKKIAAGVFAALTTSAAVTQEKNLKAAIAAGGLTSVGAIYALVELIGLVVNHV